MAESSKFWQPNTTGDGIYNPYSEPTDVATVLNAVAGAFDRTSNAGGVFQSQLNGLAVTAASANTASPCSLASGRALVYGTWYESTAPLSFVIATPSTSTRVDRIVLRKDWTAQTVRAHLISGTQGAGSPSLVQNLGSTWDIPLASVSITTGGVITLTDQREYIPTSLNTQTLSLPLSVPNGGTGASALTPAHGLILAESSSLSVLTPGSTNQVLIAQGASADPTWSSGVPLLAAGNTFTAAQTIQNLLQLNQAADLPTAAALALPTTSNEVRLTGTVSITSFTNVPTAGTPMILRHQSAAGHIVNGSNIVLANTADYISTANSCIAFVSDGTNMIEFARSQKSVYKKLGYAAVTSNQNITATASPGTDVTSLTVTCTPDGVNDVKVTICMPDVETGGPNIFVALQKDGTIVNTITQPTPAGGGSGFSVNLTHIDAAPTAASHVYKVSAWLAGAGTLKTINADGTTPTNLILVEQIG